MARFSGKDGAIELGASAIAEVESFDLEVSVNEQEADVISEQWTSVVPGKKSATGTVNCIFDPTDATQELLVEGAEVTLTLYPAGNTTGLKSITGTFLVTSVSRSTTASDIVKKVANVRNQGALTEATIA